MSAAQLRASHDMESMSRKHALRAQSKQKSIYRHELPQFTGRNRLAFEDSEADLSSGNRVCSMLTFSLQIMPFLTCPSCATVGSREAYAQEEISHGLARSVVFTCRVCVWVMFLRMCMGPWCEYDVDVFCFLLDSSMVFQFFLFFLFPRSWPPGPGIRQPGN